MLQYTSQLVSHSYSLITGEVFLQRIQLLVLTVDQVRCYMLCLGIT